MEVLAPDRHDTKYDDNKSDELIRKLKHEVDVAKPKAANEAEANVLRLYGKAADTFHLAILRSRAPAAGAPQETNAAEAQSSSDLWNTARGRLQAAENVFFPLHGLRLPVNRFRNQFFDPPIKANKPPNYQYPWPR